MQSLLRVRALQSARIARTLTFEPLEDRRMLSAAPWQNAALPLDVDQSGSVVPLDALIVVNELLLTGPRHLTPLVEGRPTNYIDTNGDGMLSSLDALTVINRLLTPPEVTLTTLTPFSLDLTPRVTISASGPAAIPDGTAVVVDVDLNNNGSFADPGESNRTVESLFQGAADFALNPALPTDPAAGPYTIQMRAHVVDSDGVEGVSATQSLLIDTTTSDALKNYVQTPDASYHYSVANTVVTPQYTFYVLDMTSQTWRSSADVNKPVWRHWLDVYVPASSVGTTALLSITGGNNTFGTPSSTPDPTMVQLSLLTHTVVATLHTIPSEPLIFTDETTGRSEDQIIAYTFDKFMDNLGQPGNETWPVLVAMVKSAVRAMDTVQVFVPQKVAGAHIDDFLVTGYSKRGWTTWLTAAVDDRVKAIIPGVFDNLDQGIQMVHHYGVYGFFSPAVQDYNNLHIFDRILTPEGQELSKIVDPYRYLNNGRFTIPKLLINSAGDEFFVSDSAQYYFDDLPGNINYVRYLPNTGHSLDARAITSTTTFYDAILNNAPLPKFSWNVQADGAIQMHSIDVPSQVVMWQATNPVARDFRHLFNPQIVWNSSALADTGNNTYIADPPMPNSGATAYFIEMTYPSLIPGMPYVFTTEIRVESTLPLYAWPFPSGFPTSTATAASSTATSDTTGFDVVASGLSMHASTVATLSDKVANSQLSLSTSAQNGSAVVSNATPVVSLASLEDDPLYSTESPMLASLADAVFGSTNEDELS